MSVAKGRDITSKKSGRIIVGKGKVRRERENLDRGTKTRFIKGRKKDVLDQCGNGTDPWTSEESGGMMLGGKSGARQKRFGQKTEALTSEREEKWM